jgi:NAD-dependent SIR2 family protein deacetylase
MLSARTNGHLPNANMDALAPLTDFAKQHPKLLVLTGAGCSTEAGIPDYRDANGAWKRNEPMRFQLFVADALARKRYWARSMLGWRTMAAVNMGRTRADALLALKVEHEVGAALEALASLYIT